MRITFTLNGESRTVETDGEQPLLWVLRDELDLKGTKFGCGRAACGACTVHIDGDAVRSCSFPARYLEGRVVTTLEGLGTPEAPHPVQQAWIEEIVPQCGYCQPGFIMATAALLAKNPSPTDDDIDRNIVNVCRCGTYVRMRKAIHRAAELTRAAAPAEPAHADADAAADPDVQPDAAYPAPDAAAVPAEEAAHE